MQLRNIFNRSRSKSLIYVPVLTLKHKIKSLENNNRTIRDQVEPTDGAQGLVQKAQKVSKRVPIIYEFRRVVLVLQQTNYGQQSSRQHKQRRYEDWRYFY